MPKIAKPISSERKISEEDTMQEDEKLMYEEEHRFSPENTVRISDVNKEIAKEWKKEDVIINLKDRTREEKIEKINKRKK